MAHVYDPMLKALEGARLMYDASTGQLRPANEWGSADAAKLHALVERAVFSELRCRDSKNLYEDCAVCAYVSLFLPISFTLAIFSIRLHPPRLSVSK